MVYIHNFDYKCNRYLCYFQAVKNDHWSRLTDETDAGNTLQQMGSLEI